MEVIGTSSNELLVVTEQGFGKRTEVGTSRSSTAPPVASSPTR